LKVDCNEQHTLFSKNFNVTIAYLFTKYSLNRIVQSSVDSIHWFSNNCLSVFININNTLVGTIGEDILKMIKKFNYGFNLNLKMSKITIIIC